MIHSGIDENWLRVEILYGLAYRHHVLSEERRRNKIEPKEKVFFDPILHDENMKQSCIVGMVIVWSVVTLEALVNQALAETIECRKTAIEAIEYPKANSPNNRRSELARKICNIPRNEEVCVGILDLSDRLCELRNGIVHDKPFVYTDFGDGEFEIDHLRKRGEPLESRFTYQDLREAFTFCDKIREFLLRTFDASHLKMHQCSYISLLENYSASFHGEMNNNTHTEQSNDTET